MTYYGLRSYAGVPPRAWGGDPGHAHEWGPALGPHHPGQVEQTKWKTAEAAGKGQTAGAGSFCRCGAWLGCLGLEPDPGMYLSHLVEIFRAVRLAIRPDAVAWVNVGDTYAGGGDRFTGRNDTDRDTPGGRGGSFRGGIRNRLGGSSGAGLKPGDRIGIPERLVLALREDGWTWRQTVVWSKVNPLPESVSGWRWERCRVRVRSQLAAEFSDQTAATGSGNRRMRPSSGGVVNPLPGFDTEWAPCPGCPKCEPNDGLVLRCGSWRPTTAHEYLYMLTPSGAYYGDGEAVREAASPNTHDRGHGLNPKARAGTEGVERQNASFALAINGRTSGRNPRSVWEIPSEAFPEAHFATFPRRLVEPCILSSTPAAGSCSECGAPWAPVVERDFYGDLIPKANLAQGRNLNDLGGQQRWAEWRAPRTLGHRPTCSCGAPPRPALVLDPFAGSGTVGLVAIQHGRRFVGIERSPTYCSMARHRIGSADPEHVAAQPVRMAAISGPLFEGVSE